MKSNITRQLTVLAISLAGSVFAQGNPDVQFHDSLSTPKNIENYNNFQVDKWGPVTYSGDEKCDIVDLYQRSVAQGLSYSTIVDYHFKQTKEIDKYTCKSWGLGISFKVLPDSSKYSQDHGLEPNAPKAFSAQSLDAVKKLFSSDSAFLEVESIKPVSFQTTGECHIIDFLYNTVNEQSGFHGIVDIKFDESLVEGENTCTFWGLAVKYKRRNVIEKTVTKKRVIEVIEIPPPPPDTVLVPVPAEPEPQKNNCCFACCCNN